MAGRWVERWIPIVGAGLLMLQCAPTGAAAPRPGPDAQAKAAAEPQQSDFPRPPGDPASIARGKQIFSVNCAFCHGADAHGGEGGGPNLLRSPIVLNDQKGEAIYAVMLAGRVDKGMPKFNLSFADAAAIAAYIHSIPIGRGAGGVFDPKDILVGNAAAGKRYFYGKGHCNQCHSLQGDLAHIGTRLDPKTLQDNIVSGGVVTKLGAPLPTAPPRTVTVTLESGEVL